MPKPTDPVEATLPLPATLGDPPPTVTESSATPMPPTTLALPPPTRADAPPTATDQTLDDQPDRTAALPPGIGDSPTRDMESWRKHRPSSPIPDTIAQSMPALTPQIPGMAVVEGYDILGELGRGGMGVVYKARQRGLNRLVALKMILSGAHAGRQELARFRAEAEAVARLQHPHIVQIYDVGIADSRPYFSLEYVEGGSLADKLKGEPLPPRQAAALVETLARAMQYAHEKGIVHRDLKPANILLTGRWQVEESSRLGSGGAATMAMSGSAPYAPKITDFGLAKDIKEDTGQTKSGSVLGTPNYMAPEQASGKVKEIGPAADVYALGAILYELLTGRPPFSGESAWEVVKQVINEEPLPPTRLRRGLNRDLETICLKRLQKEPKRRYASALHLADDLHRCIDGQAILARPVSDWEAMVKWAQRNPAIASLSLALFAVIVGSIVGLTIAWRNTEGKRKTAVVEKTDAVEQAKKEQELRTEAQRSYDRSRREAYSSQLNLAQNALAEARFDRAQSLLDGLAKRGEGEEDLRGFEWHYLWQLANSKLNVKGHTNLVSGLAFSPDGSRMTTSSLDGTVKIWDPKSGNEQFTLKGHEGPVRAVAFSGDGTRVATGGEDGTARLWDAETGKSLRVLSDHAGWVTSLAFSADGKRLATASEDKTARLWDLDGSAAPVVLKGHDYGLTAIAFRRDGKQVATASWDRTARLWNADDGKEQHKLEGHSHWIRALAYSGDSKRLATASWDKTVKLWNPADGSLTRTLAGGEAPTQQLSFSPDSQRLLTLGTDQIPQMWDLTGAEDGPQRVGDGGPVRGIAFSPDGQLLASVRFDFTGKALDSDKVLAGHGSSLHAVAFQPKSDLMRIATASADSVAKIWQDDGKGWEAVLSLKGHDGPIRALAFSPDGTLLATGGEDGTIRLWNPADGAERRVLRGHKGWVTSLSFSADGKRLASGGEDKTARVWEIEGEGKPSVLEGHPDGVQAVAFVSDGKKLATGAGDGKLRVWDRQSGKLEQELEGHRGQLRGLAVSADGKHLASAGWDGVILLRKTADWKVEQTLRGHTYGVTAVAFAADGKRLASASEDRTVKLWDLSSGRELLTLSGHEAGVTGVAFNADASALASSCWDRKLRLWTAPREK